MKDAEPEIVDILTEAVMCFEFAGHSTHSEHSTLKLQCIPQSSARNPIVIRN